MPIAPEKASRIVGSRLSSRAVGASSMYATSTSPFFSMAARVVASGTVLNTSRFTDGVLRQ